MSASAASTPRARVALLETSVAERIAAGEVIERPSSIIKELVENAVDAGSTRIWVDIRDGGQSFLKVVDDGCGMSRDDAALALNRFATSKIRTWEDMENLQTLGFRGEALPSIIAVSRLELLTRETGAPSGTRIVARGADDVRVEDAGCAEGTTAMVTDLFFNTPARRKFLKSGVAEAARIVDLLGRFSLLHTNIHFRLTSGEREYFNLPHQYGLADRLKRLWQLDPKTPVAPLGHVRGDVKVSGVAVCPPTFASQGTRQVIYVNGRLVVSKQLSIAIAQGFEPLIPHRRFPMAVVFIELPSGDVDVNVHPTKSEVRFLHPDAVFRAVRDAIAQALTEADAQPQDHVEAIVRATDRDTPSGLVVDVDEASLHSPSAASAARVDSPTATPSRSSPGATPAFPQGRTRPTAAQVDAALAAVAPLEPQLAEAPASPAPVTSSPRHTAEPPTPEDTAVRQEELPTMPMPVPLARVATPSASRWQALAQLHRTYIIGLHDGDLWIVDQHTAHERVNYEQLAHITDGSRAAASQPLLFPVMLELGADEAAALTANLEVFDELGYQIEPFGPETVVVRALPAGLSALSRADVLRQIIAEVVGDDRAREPHRLRELLRATTACRASVMAGDTLTREEMETLLSRLEAVPRGGYCPHGRPVSIRLGEDDLGRLFGRR